MLSDFGEDLRKKGFAVDWMFLGNGHDFVIRYKNLEVEKNGTRLKL